jgi:hypothetical protein
MLRSGCSMPLSSSSAIASSMFFGSLALLLVTGHVAGCAHHDDGAASGVENLDEGASVVSATDGLTAYLKDIGEGGPQDSWKKHDAKIRNFGCAAPGSPLQCLGQNPAFTLQGQSILGPAKAQLDYRIVNLLSGGSLGPSQPNVNEAERPMPLQETQFWVRSSADGRYVGMSQFVLDLERWMTKSKGAMIRVAAPFDPQFTADDKTMSFAAAAGAGITVCNQSALDQTNNDATAEFDFDDDSCTTVNNGVYESFGASLDSALPMFMTDSKGAHTNDPGVGNIEAQYGPTAATQFTPLRFNGTSFDALAPVNVTLPFEGDVMLSPSGRLFISRVSDGTKQTGYRISHVDATPNGASFAVKATPFGAIRLRGAKAGFSFDERFVVTHSYADQADPSLAIAPGSADIVLVDLVTGTLRQLTQMPAGVRALYPHFRADGWLYFLVRDGRGAQKREYILATDAALKAAATP